MASFIPKLLLLISLFQLSLATRRLTELYVPPTTPMQYHNGPLLVGQIKINLIFYGKFTSAQRAIVADFVSSLSSPRAQNEPSVATWWKATDKYYEKAKSKKSTLSLGSQILDEGYSLGKSLKQEHIKQLASKGDQMYAINVVLTADDVLVEGFCMTCGTHGFSTSSAPNPINGKHHKYAYVWVGNSETQCPGQCAWPYYKPMYGPKTPPLIPPNNDVGMDGVVINLAGLLAGTVTNPFGKGYYQGDADAPMEAASACPGVYGTGAYPGFPGNLLVDASTGASYNCHGSNGRKHLVPAIFDPTTSSCSTLV